MPQTNNILSLLEGYTLTNADDIGKDIAHDFQRRRIEKGITREMMAEKSGVAVSNIARFERLGLISLTNLIELAMALGYVSELRHVFSAPKYSTTEELLQIRQNMKKKRAKRK